MRMTCKYVVYLNVFHSHTHLHRHSTHTHTHRSRLEPMLRFRYCGIKPTNNLSQHEFFLTEKLWQKRKRNYIQTYALINIHTYICMYVYIKYTLKLYFCCLLLLLLLLLLALLSCVVVVVGLINRFAGLAQLSSARLGLAWFRCCP